MYIHRNPVSGKWQLVPEYTEYQHSSASFYETGEVKNYEPFDYRLLQRAYIPGLAWAKPR